MKHDRFESFLWAQILLVGLLGSLLALFLSNKSLQTPYALPDLRLVLATIFMLITGLLAALAGTRFGVEGRVFDLLLCAGFLVTALSWLVFTVAPGVDGAEAPTAALTGRALGWALIASAPFARGRVRSREAAIAVAVAASACSLVPIWLVLHSSGGGADTPLLSLQALLQLLAAIGFGERYRSHGGDLDRWLSFVSTLTVFASLGLIFTPNAAPTEVARGDVVALAAHGVLLVALWRAVRAAEFGRAVAEERARVAREVHDGLAQYLFTITTNALMLETGADPAVVLPRLKEAALAAQREARYAILALSTAAGRQPFDTALRRYVELLTADGALDVEIEIDNSIRLGPDEQIELLRIVQEGLSNARRHGDARHARVEIGERAGERFVLVHDDGGGFVPDAAGAGQGLRNMRERAASIGGALSLRSAPGRGTSLEVVLRA